MLSIFAGTNIRNYIRGTMDSQVSLLFRTETILDWRVPESHRLAYADGFMSRLGYTLLGTGRHRRTYISHNRRYVIKFPINEYGMRANVQEAKTYKRHKNKPNYNGVVYAPCRLIQGCIVMMWAMETVFGTTRREIDAGKTGLVKNVTDHPMFPAWAYHIDSSQVGIMRNGRIAAYDYTED